MSSTVQLLNKGFAMPIYLFNCLFTYLSIHPPIHPSLLREMPATYLGGDGHTYQEAAAHPSKRRGPLWPSIYLSIHLSTYPPTYLSHPSSYPGGDVHLSTYLGKDGHLSSLSTYLGKDGHLFSLSTYVGKDGHLSSLSTYLGKDCHLSFLSTYPGKDGNLFNV